MCMRYAIEWGDMDDEGMCILDFYLGVVMIKCCIFSTNFVGKTFVHTFYIFVTHNTYNYYICAHSLHICIGIITLIKQKSTLKWVM